MTLEVNKHLGAQQLTSGHKAGESKGSKDVDKAKQAKGAGSQNKIQAGKSQNIETGSGIGISANQFAQASGGTPTINFNQPMQSGGMQLAANNGAGGAQGQDGYKQGLKDGYQKALQGKKLDTMC